MLQGVGSQSVQGAKTRLDSKILTFYAEILQMCIGHPPRDMLMKGIRKSVEQMKQIWVFYNTSLDLIILNIRPRYPYVHFKFHKLKKLCILSFFLQLNRRDRSLSNTK